MTKLDRAIRQACRDYLAARPMPETVPEYTPSPALSARLDETFSAALADKHRSLTARAVHWTAAASAAVLLVSAGLWSATPQAQAAIRGWTRKMVEIGNQRYSFGGEITGETLSKYQITALPAGYSFHDELEGEGYYSVNYVHENEEDQIRLYCVRAQEGKAVSLEITDARLATIVPVTVGELEGDKPRSFISRPVSAAIRGPGTPKLKKEKHHETDEKNSDDPHALRHAAFHLWDHGVGLPCGGGDRTGWACIDSGDGL